MASSRILFLLLCVTAINKGAELVKFEIKNTDNKLTYKLRMNVFLER